eukprot:CAMPEP_0172657714 /NCGR_PEP_ID=MMETSP1074-20121228/2278_1 /TAXON_ID=2916 /ORGANISM="Ceratium fusus, Strain PA161109" /LENGTH=186 /DNA_ID=CAMNT_0013472851 /DNA_START=134 /DNA_END=694 /DNA_ORIENTATION=+
MVEDAEGRNTYSGVQVNQRWHACSTGQPLLSNSYMNCLGIVIASFGGSGGCLAHVEAEGTAERYQRAAEVATQNMLNWLWPKSGNEPLGFALFGNSQGHQGDGLAQTVWNKIHTVTGLLPAPYFDPRGQRPWINGGFFLPRTNQLTVCRSMNGCQPGPPLNPDRTTVVVQDQHEFIVTNGSDTVLV